MEVLIAVIAGLVAVNAQFTPQAKPICRRNGVIAGPGAYLPHETYCQLYYHCNLEHAYEMPCAADTVFNPALPGCLPANNLQFSATFCTNWICDSKKYPDICCSRYWTCVNNIFVQRECLQGEVFDMAIGQCTRDTTRCLDNQFCEKNRPVPDLNDRCTLGEVVGDKCKFTMFGAPGNMSCPAGTEFNKKDCGCVHSQVCHDSLPNFAANKLPDGQCQASYRTDFDTGMLNAYSDKMNYKFRNAFHSAAQPVNGDVSLVANTETELYSYYYVRNQIVAPMAMEIVFKLDQNTPTQQFDLITNEAPFHLLQAGHKGCAPTFSVGVNANYNRMDFTVMAMAGDGPNKESLQFSASNTNTQSYYKFVMSFSQGILKAQVFDMGQTAAGQGYSVGTGMGAVELGTRLKVNECGLTIGHSMTGLIRKWAMYEGCINPNTITQIQG